MFRKNDLQDGVTVIHQWKGGEPLEILWEKGESWADVIRRYDLHLYDSFSDFVEYEEEDKDTKYPYSVLVYEFEHHFLICKWDIYDFSYLQHTCVVDKNYFNVLEFYKEMCFPFMGIKEKNGS